jgi:hypothetical protein
METKKSGIPGGTRSAVRSRRVGREVRVERSRASLRVDMNWQCAVQTGESSGSCRSCLYISSKLDACEGDQSRNALEVCRGFYLVQTRLSLLERVFNCERLINVVLVERKKVMILYTLR